jgi:hypothetical protein
MLAVFSQKPGLSLVTTPSVGDARLTAQIRADVPQQLFGALTEEARGFCMETTEIIRVYLQMALDFYGSLVPANEIPRKEELARQILRELSYRQELGRYPSGLKWLGFLLIRRKKR